MFKNVDRASLLGLFLLWVGPGNEARHMLLFSSPHFTIITVNSKTVTVPLWFSQFSHIAAVSDPLLVASSISLKGGVHGGGGGYRALVLFHILPEVYIDQLQPA